MVKTDLSIIKILVGGDNVAVELGGEVVVGVLGDIMPFSLRLLSSHNKLVLLHALGNVERSISINHIGVSSEVWDWVVNFVTTLLLLVLVLVAAGGGADGVRLEVHVSLSLHFVLIPWSEGLFSVGGVAKADLDVVVETEVWDEIVHWWLRGWLEGSSDPWA